MRKDLPPVKDILTGQEVRSANKDHDGQPVQIFISNEVAGILHWNSLPKEMHMELIELVDIVRQLGWLDEFIRIAKGEAK